MYGRDGKPPPEWPSLPATTRLDAHPEPIGRPIPGGINHRRAARRVGTTKTSASWSTAAPNVMMGYAHRPAEPGRSARTRRCAAHRRHRPVAVSDGFVRGVDRGAAAAFRQDVRAAESTCNTWKPPCVTTVCHGVLHRWPRTASRGGGPPAMIRGEVSNASPPPLPASQAGRGYGPVAVFGAAEYWPSGKTGLPRRAPAWRQRKPRPNVIGLRELFADVLQIDGPTAIDPRRPALSTLGRQFAVPT